jgi:hypothetical protein
MLELIEDIAVDYFELNGFLVKRNPGTFTANGNSILPAIVARNLREDELQDELNLSFQWFSHDIAKTRRAVLVFIPQALNFTGPRNPKSEKRWFQQLSKDLSGKKGSILPWEAPGAEVALAHHRFLILLPFLPGEPQRTECQALLAARQAHGVITVRTLIDRLIQQLPDLEPQQLTPRLHLLQLIKQMDLLRTPQLDLFH